jgi:hypothetical protein
MGAWVALEKGRADGLSKTLADTRAELTACSETRGGIAAANVGYKAAVDEQQRAWSEMKVGIDKIADDAKGARIAAEKASTVAQRSADRILSAKPQSADLCREAAALFKRTMEENRP